MSVCVQIRPLPGPARGVFDIPASKSFLNRALVCAALADGESVLGNTGGQGEDVSIMRRGLETLGVRVTNDEIGNRFLIRGRGGRFWPTGDAIDVGEAGTAARFLTALACLARMPVRLLPGPRMAERPMTPLLGALQDLGATTKTPWEEGYPCTVDGQELKGGSVRLRADVSSQFLSALLMLGPVLPKGLEVHCEGDLVSRPYIDLTIRVMEAFGAQVEEPRVGAQFHVSPGGYRPAELFAPPDASSAIFLLAAAAITDGAITVRGLDERWPQADLEALDVLRAAGCEVEKTQDGLRCVGAPERGLEGDLTRCPDATPALAAVAAFAPGPSMLRGLTTLAVKESDRLRTLERGLRNLGSSITAHPDSLEIRPAELHGGEVDPNNDHRIAMAFALLGLRIPCVRVCNAYCVEKSWPGFWKAVEEIERASS